MSNRRDFIRKIAVAGTATCLLPDMTNAASENHDLLRPDKSPKTFLFQGDSITDGGRSFDKDWNHVFGQGYAYLIASRLNYEYPDRDYQFFNRGISGNTINDLATRWQKDTLDIKPDILSILVGINDVQGVIRGANKATADDFGDKYDKLLLQTITELPGIQLIINEPFILPVGMVKANLTTWTNELQKRQDIVKALAMKYNAVYIPLQDAFNKALKKAPADYWIWDGIHPMPAGHELIAREWLKFANKRFNIL
jgi:lysophospholipase L1-like esterase